MTSLFSRTIFWTSFSTPCTLETTTRACDIQWIQVDMHIASAQTQSLAGIFKSGGLTLQLCLTGFGGPGGGGPLGLLPFLQGQVCTPLPSISHTTSVTPTEVAAVTRH